jgi:hypothetical protein
MFVVYLPEQFRGLSIVRLFHCEPCGRAFTGSGVSGAAKVSMARVTLHSSLIAGGPHHD